MPTFCRHGRLLQNCTICAKASPSLTPAPRAPRQARARTRPTASAAARMKVRHVKRAADDGFQSELVPGLRAAEDAVRLAEEIAFSQARLAELATAPPGLYADVASARDPEEACWLAFLIAYVCPTSGSVVDAFANIESVRVPWGSGELPDLDRATLGIRSAHMAGRGPATVIAYRAWAARSGSQRAGLLGDADWEPQRRFVRTLERLALPGLRREVRFELLTTLGAVGVIAAEAGTLALTAADPGDSVLLAAKRVLGIGDTISLERRAMALARGVGVPIAALDLALHNWSTPEAERATMGAQVEAGAGRSEEIAAALGVRGATEPE